MQHLSQQIRTNGGFTADQNFNAPTSGYMVSLAGTEVQFKTFPSMSDEQLQRECQEYFDGIDWSRDDIYFGAWVHNNVLFFDNSINIKHLDVAMAFGRANNQIAIWDIAEGKEIRLTDES